MQANFSELNTPPQATNSLAGRVRWVLRHFALQQQELADAMGVKLDRVKSLVLGRAAKLRHDELVRLQAVYGLSRDWLASGEGQALPAQGAQAAAAGLPAAAVRQEDVALLARDIARRHYHPPPSAADSVLLQRVVDATSAALGARGVVLPPDQRLRLYWAVFELSMPAGVVNEAAIGPLVTLASGGR